MSTSRKEDVSNTHTKTSSWSFTGTLKNAFAGFSTAMVSTTATFFIDRLAILIQYHQKDTLGSTLAKLFNHPGRGFGAALTGSGLKQVTLFTVTPNICGVLEKFYPGYWLNKGLGGFCGGVLGASVAAPFSYLKTFTIANNMPLREAWKIMIAGGTQLNGLPMKLLADGIHNSVYFPVVHGLRQKTDNSFVAGVGAGGIAAFFSNPPSIVGVHQKGSATKVGAFETAQNIVSRYGYRGLYRGFPMLTLIKVGVVQGGVAALALDQIGFFKSKKTQEGFDEKHDVDHSDRREQKESQALVAKKR